MLGGDLRLLAGIDAVEKLLQGAARAFDLLTVPGARDQRGLAAAVCLFRKPDERRLQGVQPIARPSGDEKRASFEERRIGSEEVDFVDDADRLSSSGLPILSLFAKERR